MYVTVHFRFGENAYSVGAIDRSVFCRSLFFSISRDFVMSRVSSIGILMQRCFVLCVISLWFLLNLRITRSLARLVKMETR